MKSTIGTLALACLTLVLLAPSVSRGQRKTTVTTVTADVSFRNADGDRIQGAPTTASLYISNGRFALVDDAATGHLVSVSFAEQTVPPPSLNCGPWSLPPRFTYRMDPAYDLATPTAVQMNSYYQMEFDSSHGWAPMIESQTQSKTTYHHLNFLTDVKAGQKRYVQWAITLQVASSNDDYSLNINKAWDRDGDPGPSWGGGIVEVEAATTNALVSTKGDTFFIRPILGGQPYPLPYLGQDEANLWADDHADSRKDTSGPCMMGNYRMPFEMTVVRR